MSQTGPETVAAIGQQAGSPENAAPGVDPEVAVRTLLAMSHLSPPEDEIHAMVAGFVGARAGARLLYSVTEARYEEPALIFRARV